MVRRRRRPLGGAMVMVAAVASLTLAMFIMAGFYVGLWSNQRDEAQNQADAISIAAMEIARTQGVDAVCRHPVIQEMMRQNGNQAGRMDDCGRFVEVANGDGTTSLRFVVGTSTVMDTGNEPLLREMMGGERFTLRSRATAGVTQEAFDDAERRLPKFVMVLDYSGSMGVDFGGRSRLSALVRAVNGMLDLGLRIEYGVVMFSSNVLDRVNVGPGNENRIRNVISSRGPGGSTNYQAGLDAARDMLVRADNTGYYVLFISDGAPTAGGDPLNAADRVRASDITIFTMNIGGGRQQADLLKDMGGTMDPAEYGNPDYYFSAVNEREMLDTFQAIVANILCAVGPLQGDDLRPEDVHALLRDAAGQEIPLVRAPNLAAPGVRNTLAYNFDPAERKVRLTEAACDRVIDDGADIIVRYGQLNLVQ